MAEQRAERRLAAILAGDVAGYSKLMGADEGDTLIRLNTHRREFLDPKIGEHRGRIVKRKLRHRMVTEFPLARADMVKAVSVDADGK
jgi:adenylate cyclase